MGMTMSQKILSSHSGGGVLAAGDLINADLDIVMGSDVTTPIALQEMEKHGLTTVFDPNKIILVMDHFTPNKDIQAAQNCKKVRDFAAAHKIPWFYDVGRMGIQHALLPEQGHVFPGSLIMGADSHTCTYGALGSFSTGVGSTDMAYGMVTGQSWFKVPDAIKIELTGKPGAFIDGKDLILFIIGMIGVDGARYQSIEFSGSGVAELSIDHRFAICNMAIEAGAKNGIFPVDDLTREYLKGKISAPYTEAIADADASYSRVIKIDLADIESLVAAPHLPSNVKPVRELAGLKVDQVVIGSCANGRLSDLRQAAEIIKGKKIAPNVRCIVIPATQQIYLDALRQGFIEIFIEAGAAVSTPTCGPCNGLHMGVLADNERCLSTTNRNFVGRMGAKSSEVYLASPAVAAATALAGVIADPRT
ncbi:MAG: 3-isopropylmalate dehydratase large subunit [Treponema sp.]|jgi:3-isopropylmalate/(R)-2-methylmalate dehydratase large subunit|nr:3-isopropylmalate dehydratase large subunit [Treponema sp.]